MTSKRIKLKATTAKVFARSLKTGEETEVFEIYWSEGLRRALLMQVFDLNGFSPQFDNQPWEFELEIEESDRA